TVYSIPHISQVYMMFRAKLLDLDFSPGIESLEVKLVTAAEIPWNELAFAMVKRTLEHYIDDRARGSFVPRFGDIRPPHR
ncbi:MAG TPA: NUDIX hydrolase, partial [Usitatibacter sp.]|nr:NUDIX hydrolase [Usitatibacter sp.]